MEEKVDTWMEASLYVIPLALRKHEFCILFFEQSMFNLPLVANCTTQIDAYVACVAQVNCLTLNMVA